MAPCYTMNSMPAACAILDPHQRRDAARPCHVYCVVVCPGQVPQCPHRRGPPRVVAFAQKHHHGRQGACLSLENLQPPPKDSKHGTSFAPLLRHYLGCG
eukprot:2478430-Pyramimonas_sp.AAC.1